MQYWGKTNRKTGSDLHYHLVAYHNLDVAAIAYVILERNGPLRERLARGLSIREDRVVPFIAALMALHDIGKFSERFQKKQAIVELRDCSDAGDYSVYHDTLGYLFWRDELHHALLNENTDWFEIKPFDKDPDAADDLEGWWEWFDPIAQAITGHHGAPPDYRNHHAQRYLDKTSREDALAYARAVLALFDTKYGIKRLLVEDWSYDEAVPRAKQASWMLAGLAVLADWIGSNAGTNTERHYFEFKEDAIEIGAYWNLALGRATSAIARTGVLPVNPSPVTGLPTLFPKLKNATPTPLQVYAKTCKVEGGPHLFILEDATGSGKTEAAIILAHRIMQVGGGQGLYMGLPTMATANAMFGRLIDPDGNDHPYRKLFDKPNDASVVLAHSRRGQQEGFRDLHLADAKTDDGYGKASDKNTEPDLSGQAQCAAWLADSRKKALLAHVGVGTIDQALIGVLPSKHQSLRLLGLGTKVLVVDEVHAYDEYVSALLQDLLAFQAAMGGSAILLTATLTQDLRKKLCDSFRSGLYDPHEKRPAPLDMKETAFPLATCLSSARRDEITETRIAPRPNSARSVNVRFFHTEEAVRNHLLEKAHIGQCACWIRNTVDDAIEAYEELKDEPGVEVKLYHARFALIDRLGIEKWVLEHFGEASDPQQRKGRILIATQVVEQSLDLDFDVLVSDLAPIDLLVQRVGRQHRHHRDGRAAPVFGVLAPSWNEKMAKQTEEDGETTEKKERAPEAWLKDYEGMFSKAKFVYPHTGWLWRTAKMLHKIGHIAIPDDARLLLETVYAPDDPMPSDLLERWRNQATDWAIPNALRKASNKAFNEMKQARAQANHNALHLNGGYGGLKSGGRHWFDDTRTPTRLGEPTTTVRLAKLMQVHSDDEETAFRVVPWTLKSFDDYQALLHEWYRAKQAAEKDGAIEEEALRKAREAVMDEWQQSEVSIRTHKLSKEPDWSGVVKRENKKEKEKKTWLPKELQEIQDYQRNKDMPDSGKWSALIVLKQQDDGTWQGEGIALKRGKKKDDEEKEGPVKEVPVIVTYSEELGLQTQ